MSNKEKIGYLLEDIRLLEKLAYEVKENELYPVSFFSKSFELTHKILNDLHSLEKEQVEMLLAQMEKRKLILNSIPLSQPLEQPEVEITETVEEEPAALPDEPEIPEELPVMEEEPAVEEEETVEEKEAVDEILVDTETVTEEIVIIEEETSEEPVKVIRETEKLITSVTNSSLSDVLEKKNLADFRKAFSLNDRFYFKRELFGGDEERMNQVIHDLNDIHSLEESVSYMDHVLNRSREDAPVADFIRLLEKRFL